MNNHTVPENKIRCADDLSSYFVDKQDTKIFEELKTEFQKTKMYRDISDREVFKVAYRLYYSNSDCSGVEEDYKNFKRSNILPHYVKQLLLKIRIGENNFLVE